MPWLNSLANGSGVDTTPCHARTRTGCHAVQHGVLGASPRRGPPASNISPTWNRPGPAQFADRGTADRCPARASPLRHRVGLPQRRLAVRAEGSVVQPFRRTGKRRLATRRRRIVLQFGGQQRQAVLRQQHRRAIPNGASGSARPNSVAARTASLSGDSWSWLRRSACTRKAIMARFASVTVMPSRKPELTSIPSPSQGASVTSSPITTRTMGRWSVRAKAWSRASWPGTAMMAPVP